MLRAWGVYRKNPPQEGECLFCAGLSLSITTAVAGLALVVPVRIARHPSAITIRKLWENKGLLLTGPGRYTAHLGPHSKVVDKESSGARAWGTLPLLGSRPGGKGLEFRGLSLYWWVLKQREGNLKRTKTKEQVARRICYWNQPKSLKQRRKIFAKN